MSRALRHYFILAIAGLLLAPALLAADGSKGNLVDADWLAKNLHNPDVLILDASFPQAYAAKHIPGAVNVVLYSYILREDTMSDADTEKLYDSWGISPGKKIVMYDEGGTNLATRLLFSLYYHGFPEQDLLILDGGLSKWQEKGLPVTKDPTPPPAKGSFKVTNAHKDADVKLPEFLTASGDPAHNAIVEALEPDWHYGETAFFDRPGHVPNSIMTPGADFYNADKTFKSPAEIRKMMDYLGVKPDQHVYTLCGGGVAASIPFFALKFLLDYPSVKLYPGSELDYLSDQRELPFWTYDEPFLMRQTNWLKFQTSNQGRMFGVANANIVDVRPAAEFNQGHVPFALNIPSEVFKSNFNNPAKLAGILGPAGVNAADEAVVVSGGGLTKDSALAFVVLEKLGQKRVSIYTDSLDNWTQLGNPLTKNPTAVGPKSMSQPLSIPPTTYPDNFRPGILVTDGKAAHGDYPKVFIASGKDVPAKAEDGKVVHVPYSELLNADGTPKPAKDIWKILSKAGVPRYGELICVSDDPGEASVNYFILKLMGFPDVKVLAL